MDNFLNEKITLVTIYRALLKYREHISPSNNLNVTVNIYANESCDLLIHDLLYPDECRILKFKNSIDLFLGLTRLLIKEAFNTEIRGETILDFIPISDINTTEYRVNIDTFLLDTITPA